MSNQTENSFLDKQLGDSSNKSIEDIVISFAPDNFTPEEIKLLMMQDVRTDFYKISRSLEDFHGVFYQMWDMGYPDLTFEIPTAAVRFDRDGNHIDFMFNPVAWQKLDLYTKAFVIGHECLHVMLNHGIRTKNCPLPKLANIALDIVVNHMLVNKFGFNRASLDLSPFVEGVKDEHEQQVPYKNDRGDDIVLCWIDTVFQSSQGSIKRNKAFEYYYAILEENVIFSEDGKGMKIKMTYGSGKSENVGGRVLDDHHFLKDFSDEEVQDYIAEEINNSRLTEEEKQNFAEKVLNSEEGKQSQKSSEENKEAQKSQNKDGSKGGVTAGTLAARLKYKPNHYGIVKKRKWETVIKKWCRRHKKEDALIEQWAKKNRRFSEGMTNLMIPADVEYEGKDEQRIDVVFYQDFSGSCFHLKDRFFKAAMSLPKDRFNVILKCFDTECHFVDPKDPDLVGGGGTSFAILERDVQIMIKDGTLKRHPDAIFVITDGYGDLLSPQFPSKWYFFLSENVRYCLPKESQILMLEDFNKINLDKRKILVFARIEK